MDAVPRSLDIDSIPTPLWIYDPQTLAFVDVNAAACARYGYAREQFLAMTILDIRPEAEREGLLRYVAEVDGAGPQTATHGPWRHVRSDGSLVEVEISSCRIEYNGRPARLVLATDISERLRAQERVDYLARHDLLTGLPNRARAAEFLETEIRHAQLRDGSLGVLILDIDGFRRINDTLGHARGDELLRNVAQRLQSACPERGLVARYGSDAFVIIAPGVASSDAARSLAHRLQVALRAPIVLGRHESVINVAIGISRYPDDALEAENLFREADTALVRAQALGHGAVQEFASRMHALALKRLTLERQLRRAWDRNELWLAYQPLVDISSWRVIGAEALLRWHHSEIGDIPPNEFIPIAEEIGMIAPIGEWVLREACTQAAAWGAGKDGPFISVNISARQFGQHDLGGSIERALEMSKLDPRLLELELTESSVMQDLATSKRVMDRLKAMNVRLSVDDFGTGYSSFGYLKEFPLDTLKIDRSFICDIDNDPFDEAIATAIVTLAHSLQLRVIAEGVESASQLETLRRIGCDELQGFYFSEPVTARVFEGILERGFKVPAEPPRRL